MKYSEGLQYRLNEDGKSYSVAGIGKCKDNKIVIPAAYKELPVTGIDNYAFIGYKAIKSVIMPDTITSIGFGAFCDCLNLKKVRFSNNLISIGDDAFSCCFLEGDIILPEGLISIGNGAFYQLSYWSHYPGSPNYITKIVIPGTVKFIGKDALKWRLTYYTGDYMQMRKVEVHRDNKYYKTFFNTDINKRERDAEFDARYALIEESSLEYILNKDGKSYSVAGIGKCKDNEIIVPSEYKGLPVTAIADKAFILTFKLTSITLPDSVTSIGYEAFKGSSLTTAIMPNVKLIGKNAFDCCSFLKNVVMDNVRYIEEGAFSNCSSLENITLPKGLRSIEKYAFFLNKSLKEIIIPESVSKIGKGAFWCCESLESITFPNGNVDRRIFVRSV